MTVYSILTTSLRLVFRMNCSNATKLYVYVDIVYRLDEAMAQFGSGEKKNRPLYKDKEQLGEETYGWYMYDLYWDKGLVTTRMNLIFTSGIFQKWEESQDLGLRKMKPSATDSPEGLGLSTNVLTVFYRKWQNLEASFMHLLFWLEFQAVTHLD
jgi:hypothetical protein